MLSDPWTDIYEILANSGSPPLNKPMTKDFYPFTRKSPSDLGRRQLTWKPHRPGRRLSSSAHYSLHTLIPARTLTVAGARIWFRNRPLEAYPLESVSSPSRPHTPASS